MTHTQHEDHGWTVRIPNHPKRADSPEYKRSRNKMIELAGKATDVAAIYQLRGRP